MTRQRVPNPELAADTARQNLLTNGGFEIWQRGAGPFTANGFYTADRWHINLAGTDTMSVQRSAVRASGRYAAQIAFTLGTGGGNTGFFTRIRPGDGLEDIQGRTVSLSMFVACNAPNAVRIGLSPPPTGAVLSGFHSGSGGYERMTVSVVVPVNATDFYIGLYFNATASVTYVDDAMLVVGDVPTNFVPLHPADDLARCLRYYEVFGEGAQAFAYQGYCLGSSAFSTPVFFKVRKAATPSATKVGTWGVLNCPQPNFGTPYLDMMYITALASTTGATQFYNNTAPAITVEANP